MITDVTRLVKRKNFNLSKVVPVGMLAVFTSLGFLVAYAILTTGDNTSAQYDSQNSSLEEEINFSEKDSTLTSSEVLQS